MPYDSRPMDPDKYILTPLQPGFQATHVAPPTNPHSDLSHAPRDRDFPAAMVTRVMREVSRVCAVATEAEALEILLGLSERLAELNPAPKPFTPQVDDGGAFPGIFAGTRAGDFAGLPQAPGEVTARVPELAVQLSGIAESIGVAIRLDDRWSESNLDDNPATREMHEALTRLYGAKADLHAIVDKIEAEAGVQ